MNTDYQEAKNRFEKSVANSKSTGMKFTSVSGEEVKVLYSPDDLNGHNFMEKISFPGEYPYTRGIHPNGYRGKVWTMRQFAGFGSPEDTNERFKY